jgi:hypothetical protein
METVDDMTVIMGKYRADWERLGEGYDGDFNEDDPNDVEFYRFDTYELVEGEWEEIRDGSYCTAMPVGTPENVLLEGLMLIVANLNAVVDTSPKRELEALSWMNPSWFEQPEDER